MTTQVQLGLMFAVALLYALAFVVGLRHIRRAADAPQPSEPGNTVTPSMGRPARLLVAVASLLGITLLAWRAWSEKSLTLPLSHHLDAFLVLGLLLAIMLMYFRWTRHLRGLSFFMLPMIVVVMLLGGLLEACYPKPYDNYSNVWNKIHIATIVGCSACFALACVTAIVYLLADRNLKHKRMDAARRAVRFPPLASMEKFNRWMVYLGFPLLTTAMVTGAMRLAQGVWDDKTHQLALPKLAMATLAWVVYAVLLLRAPSFRGSRAAWLLIVGFFFVLGGYVASLWIK